MSREGYTSVKGAPAPSQAREDQADAEESDGDQDPQVSEVQFSFFEGQDEDASSRAPSPGSSVGDRLRNGLNYFTSGEITTQMLNLARVIVFLTLLGVLPAALIFIIDLSVHAVTSAREKISVNETGGIFGFFIYIMSGVVLCLLSTLVCRVLSTEAEGSGIPQMKAIMSGFYDKCKPSLSMWALLAKGLGLICAIGGGLPVGWEGPNVHISCIIAHHLSRLPMFRVLRRDRALRLQFMASACSVGLASSFGTPFGGVLYALETTSSFYLVPTFWKSVLATLTGAIFYDILYKTPLVEALESTQFEQDDYHRSQLVAFAILGCVMGIAGAFFVKCVKFVYDVRKRNSWGGNRFLLVGTIGFVAALVSYKTNLFRLDPREAINELFSSDKLHTLSWLDVLLLLIIKFPLVVVSIGLPVPAGVFIPCFLLGSAMGRLYGEVLKVIFGSSIVPGGFAVVGAAAFTAGVTRALSCAVVLFEVTGQLQHMLPSLVAVLLAVIVGNGFGRGLYDTLIIMKNLPYMPHMRRDLAPYMTARQVMDRQVVKLPDKCTVAYAEDILRHKGRTFDSYPVCTSYGGLIGSIRRSTLSYLVEKAKLNAKGGQRSGGDPHRDSALEMDDMGDIGTLDVTAPVPQRPSRQQSVPELPLEPALEDGKAQNEGDDPDGQNTRDLSQVTLRIEPDLAPLTVTEKMLLGQVHFMFVMLMPTHVLVLSKGRLVGVVRRRDIIFTGKTETERFSEIQEQ